ncbi:guanylate cyclase [Endozoicomonas montiporae]|uniref:Guanylate cyclase n=2 Tax=Endozoicomonas montiporae TaxID=1027273 RepID=A0A081N7F7_9GAMM|nr:GAF domain-containing protein [Endozoicomonas montiporae]AMO55778.1 GAF domain-containing protein [Endozoicomonas montiporae CL-33]KEQ14380.1 guanylate cyclase [Endozoicomonas montiporae]
MFEAPEFPDHKPDFYRLLTQQAVALIEGETDTLANLANTASLLFTSMADVNWAGFYIVRGKQLVLGPFMGKPACVRIPIGRGVCGTAACEQQTIMVDDVHAFPGHIACDGASRSEIVVPLIVNNEVVAVLDIDSPSVHRFDQDDQIGLEAMVQQLEEQLAFSQLFYSVGR